MRAVCTSNDSARHRPLRSTAHAVWLRTRRGVSALGRALRARPVPFPPSSTPSSWCVSSPGCARDAWQLRAHAQDCLSLPGAQQAARGHWTGEDGTMYLTMEPSAGDFNTVLALWQVRLEVCKTRTTRTGSTAATVGDLRCSACCLIAGQRRDAASKVPPRLLCPGRPGFARHAREGRAPRESSTRLQRSKRGGAAPGP